MQRQLLIFIFLIGLLGGTSVTAQTTHYIGLVPPAFVSPFQLTLVDGAQARANQLGWTLAVQPPAAASDFAGQVTIVQHMIEQGVQAIAIDPINAVAMTAGVKAAANIPVFMVNLITPLSDPSAHITAYIGFDQWGGAAKLGQYTCQLLAKKYSTTTETATGKVFILLGSDSFSSHRRTGGYKAGLQTGCPQVQVIGEQSAEWVREQGTSVAISALQQFPDIDVFYSNDDEMAIGASLAAESVGLQVNQNLFILAIDGSQPALDLIRQGKLTATLAVDPNRMGQTVIDTMNTVLSGGTVPSVILIPSIIVDSTNLDDYVAGKTWTAPIAGSPELDNGQPTMNP